MSTFAFDLGPVTRSGPADDGLPADLLDVIGTSGDQFRDDFTRLCLYLSLATAGPAPKDPDVTIVIGTEYGNTGALAGLQRAASAKGRLLSAQVFPNATSSSAAAFVSIGLGATGRTMTLNAGALTPVIALWQALCALDRGQTCTSRLIVGDVYSPEARQDVAAEQPGTRCSSGLTQAVLTAGTAFTADFDFSATAPAPATPERNGAFALDTFLTSVRDLVPAGRAVLRGR